MSEMIVRLNQDRVKIKGCEYVQDLIRCGECKHWNADDCSWTISVCDKWDEVTDGSDFCSYAEQWRSTDGQ